MNSIRISITALATGIAATAAQAQTGGCQLTTPVPGNLSYSLTFDTDGATPEIRDVLLGASSLNESQETDLPDSAAILSRARADYANLLSALYSFGYYAGTISIQVNGQEAARISPTAFCPAESEIVVAVTPGPVFTFGALQIGNYPDIALPQGLAQGQTARSDLLKDLTTEGVAGWRQAGHAAAAVSGQSIVASHPSSQLDVAISFDPGPQTDYGRVNVQGLDRINEKFVLYMADLEAGEPFALSDLADAQRRLVDSGAFGTVVVQDTATANPDDTVDIDIAVSEQAPRRFGLGATLSSLDGLSVQGYWFHRNLLGNAERLRLDAAINGLDVIGGGDGIEYTAGVSYAVPGVFTPDTNFLGSVNFTFGEFAFYDESGFTLSAGLTHRFSDVLTVGASAFYDYAVVNDPMGETTFNTLGLILDATLDHRDHKYDPEHGYYLKGALTPFTDLSLGGMALRSTVDARIYYPLGDDGRYVAAGRLQAGNVLATDASAVPPDKLFFIGGGGSVRGYEYQSRGIDILGDIYGAQSMITASAELRGWVTDSIGVVGFLDAGLVSADAWPDFSEPWIFSTGLGVRYRTGLGSVRFDVAIPLNREPGDPSYGLYMGLGQAF